MQPRLLAITLASFLVVPVLLLTALGSTIVDNGDDTNTYTETFETEPIGIPPEESWYDFVSAGTGGSTYTDQNSELDGSRNLRIGPATSPYMAGIEFAETTPTDARNLCSSPNAELNFDVQVPTWDSNANIFSVRLTDAPGTTASPFNSFDISVVRSGTVSFVYTMTGAIRGASAAAVTFSYGTIVPPIDL